MDLLQSVRKEGSRGGVNFSWSDVKTSQHRENYLGHSLMAPVGRWQKNKDLSWYAKADDDAELTPEQRAEREAEARREEMRKVREAEEDAMARALGLPVPERNANDVPLVMGAEKQREVNRALKEALAGGEHGPDESGSGVGSRGKFSKNSRSGRREDDSRRERRRDFIDDADERDRKSTKRRHRSRSRDRSDDELRRPRHRHRHRHHRNRSRSPSRSRSRERTRRSRSRDRRDPEENRLSRRTNHDDRSRSRGEPHRRRRSRTMSRSRSRSRSHSPSNARRRERSRRD